MSDFDKEAERERLREKYERDREKRAATEDMSELLLQGATMTNAHCSDCGDPIFRYEGQEFCPTCQRTAGADGAAEPDQATASEGAAGGGSEDAAGAPSAPATADRGGTDSGDAESGRTAESPGTSAESRSPETGGGSAGTGDDPEPSVAPRSASTASPTGDPSGDRGAKRDRDTRPDTAARADTAPTRETARESLLRALTRHAQLAEGTDDARRAADHLAAAREAAEALDALDRS